MHTYYYYDKLLHPSLLRGHILHMTNAIKKTHTNKGDTLQLITNGSHTNKAITPIQNTYIHSTHTQYKDNPYITACNYKTPPETCTIQCQAYIILVLNQFQVHTSEYVSCLFADIVEWQVRLPLAVESKLMNGLMYRSNRSDEQLIELVQCSKRKNVLIEMDLDLKQSPPQGVECL